MAKRTRQRPGPESATPSSIDRVRRIADLQRQLADVINAAAAAADELETSIDAESRALLKAIKREPDASAIAAAFAEHRVSTGELASDLVEAVERRGPKVFPPPYIPVRAKWALVENLY